jgi:putative membrane protein
MVDIISNFVVIAVACLHIYFWVLEMFFWDKPLGLKVFNMTLEAAAASKTLAANQGLYNGFLAVGLLWGVYLGSSGVHITIFFLACAIIAGVYGGVTANRKILFAQALPAAIGLVFVLSSNT